MKRLVFVAVLSAVLALAATLATLATPKFIHYQGLLTDPVTGEPVPDTALSILFTIYDGEGISLWSETQPVTPHNGKFNVKLGSVNEFDDNVFAETDRYLGIKIGSDTEMSPRTPIGSVPYAFTAGNVPDTTIGKDKIKRKSIIDSLIADTTITKNQIRKKTINDSLIADTTITKHQIRKKTIIDSLIADTTITKHQIRKKTIIDSLIADTTIGKDKIRNKAIVDSLIDDEAVTGDHIRNHTIKFEDIAQNDAATGQIMKWDGESWVLADDDVGMTDNDWELIGDVLYTSDKWGIARAGNMLYGLRDSTHVNLGVACTTGLAGFDMRYVTISGGLGNKAMGEGSVVAGGGGPTGNSAEGGYCVIGGGSGNRAGTNSPSSDHATVSGGRDNEATDVYSVVGGGWDNIAQSQGATVGGGVQNQAGVPDGQSEFATVSGGFFNHAEGKYSVVSGGGGNSEDKGNSASGDYSVISGGTANEALGDYCVIGGGGGEYYMTDRNVATGSYSVISGGRSNRALAPSTTVGGGESNRADEDGATVGGGKENSATKAWSTVSGGDSNEALADYCVIAGGQYNQAGLGLPDQGQYATVGGGSNNQATGEFAVVGGGQSNQATGSKAAVGGGISNTASANHSTVGGGIINTAGGLYSTVPGGYADSALAAYSFAAGYRARVQSGHDGTFVWSDNSAGTFSSTLSHQFLIRADHGVGINTNSPTEALDVAGNVRIRNMASGSGTYSVKIDGAGILYQQTSSRRYKRDIRDLTVAAEPVLHLRPVSFQWKESGVDDIGLIAEEVERLVPELVIYDEQGRPDGVKYEMLAVYLLDVVKQQQIAIDQLTSKAAETQELKKQLGLLQQQVEALCSRKDAVSGGSDELASGK